MFAVVLEQNARRRANQPALRIKRDGRYREWTYDAVWREALRAAGALHAAGVKPDERVALCAENSPEWILAWLGIHLAGAVTVPLDAQYAPRELGVILPAARARVLLYSAATRQTAEQILSRSLVDRILSIENDSPLFRQAPLPRPIARQSDDLLTLIFTSGTTGDPKGVRLSVGNVFANVTAILQLGLVTEDDAALCVLPLHHCYALTTSVLTVLCAGGVVTFGASLRGPDILETMRESGITVTPGVPQLFDGLDRALREHVRQLSAWKRALFRALVKTSHTIRATTGRNAGRLFFPQIHRLFGARFRFFASGGAKLDAAVTARLLDLGIRVVEGYGLTETAPVVTFNPPDQIKPGSVGRPLPGVEVRIAQPDARGVGEVLVRGPNVMQGYEQRPEETAAVLENGWFHTGDLGCFDADGYLHLTGRLKEVIVMASGKNVYPEDVERCYGASPLFQDVCVLPVEHADGRVDRLQAVIFPALEEIARRHAMSVADTVRLEVAHLSQTLPTHMRVTDVRLVSSELPRTRLGKLRRVEVRRLQSQALSSETVTAVSAEDQALMAEPRAAHLVERLRVFCQREEPVLPGHHLEIDLGLDSLARVELEVVLEEEFGLDVPPEQAHTVNTVRDLLRRLSGGREAAAAPAHWDRILATPVTPALPALFHLERHAVEQWTIERIRRGAGCLSRRLFAFDAQGIGNLPTARPYVLCPTHASFSDAPLIFMHLPREQVRRLFFLGAREFFNSPFGHWMARANRIILTGTSDTLLPSLRQAAAALRLGYAVCMFPEGAISRDGCLQRPHPGAGILACELRVPLVPVLMRGTYDTFSYTHPGLHAVPLGLTIGAPILPPVKPTYANSDYVDLMKTWRAEIVRLRRQDDASHSRTAGRSPRIPD